MRSAFAKLKKDTKVPYEHGKSNNSKEATHVIYSRDQERYAQKKDPVLITHVKLSTKDHYNVLLKTLAHAMKEGDEFPVRVDEVFRKDECLYRLVIDLDWDPSKGPQPEIHDFVTYSLEKLKDLVVYQDGFDKVFVFESKKPGCLSFHVTFPVAWKGSSGNHERIIEEVYAGTDYHKYKQVDPAIYHSCFHSLRMPGADKIERDNPYWQNRPFLLHSVYDLEEGFDRERFRFYQEPENREELIGFACMRPAGGDEMEDYRMEPTRLVGKVSRAQNWEKVHQRDAHRRSVGIVGIQPTGGIDLSNRDEFDEKCVQELGERVTSGEIPCDQGTLELVKYMNRFWTVIMDDSDSKNIISKRMNVTTRDMEVNYTSINVLKAQYAPDVFPAVKKRRKAKDGDADDTDGGDEEPEAEFIKKNMFDIWKRHPQRMAKRSVEFNPRPKDFVPEKYRPRDCDFNFFDPRCILSPEEAEDAYISMKEEDLAIIEYHAVHIVCDGNYKLYDALTKFMVNKWLRPWEKPPLVFTLRGIQGCGKTLFVKAYGNSVFGKYFKVTSNVQSISGKFNGSFLDQLLFAFLDEAEAGTGTADSGTTKHVISGDTIQVERKGKDAETRPNFLNFMRATNKQHCVEAEPNTRRELVLDCNPALTEEKGCYFRKLHELIGDFAPAQRRNMGGWLHMQWLRLGKDHGLDLWNSGHGLIIPHKALAEQARFSGSNIFNWILDGLKDKKYLVHPNQLGNYINNKGDNLGKVTRTVEKVVVHPQSGKETRTVEKVSVNPHVMSPFLKASVRSEDGEIVREKDKWIPVIAEEDLFSAYLSSPVYSKRKRYGNNSADVDRNKFRMELKNYLGCGDPKRTRVKRWITCADEGDVVERELIIELMPDSERQKKYPLKPVFFLGDYQKCLENFRKVCPVFPEEPEEEVIVEDYDQNAPFKSSNFKAIPRPPILGWKDSRPNSDDFEWEEEPFRLWEFHRANNNMTWEEIEELRMATAPSEPAAGPATPPPPPTPPSSPEPVRTRVNPPARPGSTFFNAYAPDYGPDEDPQGHGIQKTPAWRYRSPTPESEDEDSEEDEQPVIPEVVQVDEEMAEEQELHNKRKLMEEKSLKPEDFEMFDEFCDSELELDSPEERVEANKNKKRKFV